MSESRQSWLDPHRLAGTPFDVGRIALGSSYGVGADGIEWAFDHGINTFYWGAIRRSGFGEGLRRLIRAGHRERMVIAVQSYVRWPAFLLRRSVESSLSKLGVDHADVLILGWYNRRPPQGILEAALDLKQRGRVRALMLSGHHRPLFPELAREGLFDLFMVRYNAAHRRAEEQVFEPLSRQEARPGICAFTATRWGTLLDPRLLPPGEAPLHAHDCYRFCLSHPQVDLVLCGARNRQEVETAAKALELGPMSADELERMRRLGDHVYQGGGLRKLMAPQ